MSKPKAKQRTVAFEAIVRTIDQACDPKLLSKKEYKEVLEDLALDIQGRLEGVALEELAEEE